LRLYGIPDTEVELVNVHDELFHWITTYHGVLANILPPERNEAIEVMDQDDRFDHWLESYNKKIELDASRRHHEGTRLGGNTGGGGKRRVMSGDSIKARLRGKDEDD
jgi:hypothetical protein